MAHNIILLVSITILVTLLQGIHAVDYTITNTAPTSPGGVSYTNEIGDAYIYQTLSSTTDFIWNIFQQTNNDDRKNVTLVSVFLDDMDGVAYTSSNGIHININGYSGSQTKGVLYHEMTHVWQWDGKGQANRGLVEGIADYVRLKAGLAPSNWVGPREGDRWNQGYDVTARFLDYCDGLRGGFVAKLNKKMRYGYSDGFFTDLLGKSVDQLWNDYKAS